MEAVEPVSSRAYQLADEYQLGTVRREYRDNNGTALWWLMALFVCAVSVLWYLQLQGWHFPSLNDRGDILSWLNFFIAIVQTLIFLLIGVLLLLGGLAGLWFRARRYVQGKRRIYVCTKGFILGRNRVTKVVRWEDIEGVQRRIVPIAYSTVLYRGGKDQVFSGGPGTTIERELTASLLPHSISAYRAGEALDFGWLTLDTQGILLHTQSPMEPRRARYFPGQNLAWRFLTPRLDRRQILRGLCVETGERFLPWSELEMPWIDETKGTLIISRQYRREHWAILPLGRVTNVVLCLAMFEHIFYSKTSESA